MSLTRMARGVWGLGIYWWFREQTAAVSIQMLKWNLVVRFREEEDD